MPPEALSGPAPRAAAPGAVLCRDLVCVAPLFLAGAWWTWFGWPDPLIDFGQQLYVPWRIAEGEVLYRDVEFYNGPLSQHVNALAFLCCGTSLRTLVGLNFVLLAATVLVLAVLLGRIASRSGRGIAMGIFATVFAFAQHVTVGNYNYVCPYAHEMTHGLLLGMAALAVFGRKDRPGRGECVGTGLLLGTCFLTKSEVFVGPAGALGFALALQAASGRVGLPARDVARSAGLVCGAALVPVLTAFLLLASAMPLETALRGTIGSWTLALNDEVRRVRLFTSGMGTDHLRGSLWSMGVAFVQLAVPAAAVAFVAFLPGFPFRAPRPNTRAKWIVAGLVAIGTAIVFFVPLSGGVPLWRELPWFQLPRALPLVLVALLIVEAIRWRRAVRAGDAPGTAAAIRRLTFDAFALGMLAKMLFNVRLGHYGFVLAMPATLACVLVLWDAIPAAIDRPGGAGCVFRAVLAPAVAMFVFTRLVQQEHFQSQKTATVGEGADAFHADDRGRLVEAVVRHVEAHTAPHETLAALPGGVIVNYLARRRTSTGYVNYMPTETVGFGEAAIEEKFRRAPPDRILLYHHDTTEFGPQYFGHDYCIGLMRWIDANYEPEARWGAPPFSGADGGAVLLRRRAVTDVSGQNPPEGRSVVRTIPGNPGMRLASVRPGA